MNSIYFVFASLLLIQRSDASFPAAFHAVYYSLARGRANPSASLKIFRLLTLCTLLWSSSSSLSRCARCSDLLPVLVPNGLSSPSKRASQCRRSSPTRKRASHRCLHSIPCEESTQEPLGDLEQRKDWKTSDSTAQMYRF
ncbi:hypothetical protein Y032_0003g1163 [Ancylostoma ceylanicum]|uniref:Secreted protein n=1 Tax=Ancylostoma ceylanicum TaxID=53326 RepID=A0A016VVM4_9BILA|nr:hypothetical protein Y032_0003g1163 [Ancylostoma ceylanicum]